MPSENSVARCLSIDTMIWSGPVGAGGAFSAALPDFDSELGPCFLDFLGDWSMAGVRSRPHHDSTSPVLAETGAHQTQTKAAIETPPISAARFIGLISPNPKIPARALP